MRALFVFLLCLVAIPAFGAERALVRAEKLFEALEFDAAAAAFEDAIREPGTRQERIRAWKGLALSEAFMGQAKQAQAHFETLLSIEPNVEVNRAQGPKIRKPYDAARKKMTDREPRGAARSAPAGWPGGSEAGARPTGGDGAGRVRARAWRFLVHGDGGRGARPAAGRVHRGARGGGVRGGQGRGRRRAGGERHRRGTAALRCHGRACLAAVASAQESAREEAAEERGPKVWPWVAGGAGVVAAGVVVGILLSRPPGLDLPPAQRTERLP